MSQRMSVRRLIPTTIFGRIFVAIFFVALLAVALFWFWFNQRFYDSLDREAEMRLQSMARTLAEKLQTSDIDEPGANKLAILDSLWEFEKNGAWLQNLYWLDVSHDVPRFIASYSAQNPDKVSILPPTPEEIEDLVYANINELEKGVVVMPDPFSAADSRRYKIVLFPLLDQMQMLESVIGIEADQEYLQLAASMRRFFMEMLAVSLFLSLIVAFIIASNISMKTSFLLAELKSIENDAIPQSADLHLREFNQIHAAMISMAKEIMRKDEHLKEVFNRKLEELAFTGAAVAHEIRNPLSAIEMHFGLLRRKLQKSDLAGSETTEIAEQLLHLRKLVESFLNYSRRVVPERERIDLNVFFDQFLKLRNGLWPSLECITDFEEPAVILFDRTMFQQICENIFANAFAAAEEITLKIGFTRSERGWSLNFANDGPQIPLEILEKLFTPFITAKPGGNGIGLALVRKLVEANGGEIVCRNEPGGVVFTLEVEEK